MRRVECRVGGGGDAGEAFEQRGGGGVEVFVGNAVDAGLTDGAEGLPVALGDDFGERHTVSGTAPGEEQDVGVGGGDFFGSSVRAGRAEEAGAGSFDQFGDPVLGVDERLAPLFAVDVGSLGGWDVLGAGAGGGDGLLD